MKATRKQRNQHKINVAVDLSIVTAFLIAMAPRFSGIAIHEWLSIAFGAAIVTHLLLHWTWIVEVTRRLFTKANWTARRNYIINTILFIDITVVIFTGIMISQSALPLLGIPTQQGGVWRGLHGISANLAVFILGLHIALHWQWIVNAVKSYVIKPLLPRRASSVTVPASNLKNEA